MTEIMSLPDPRLREILDAFEASQFDDITVHCAELRLHALKGADGAVRVVDAAVAAGGSGEDPAG